MKKSEAEHKYTSTGIKFWRHPEQMIAYRECRPNTVISTHISPEGSCNLKCSYCSVTKRDTHSRIPIETIQSYIDRLISAGLKAVIITGGGEPTLYPQINELIQWIKYQRGLSVALITNGVDTEHLEQPSVVALSWVRISVNTFNGWQRRINFPVEYLHKDAVVGMSYICVDSMNKLRKDFEDISALADRLGAEYVRLLPDCMLEQEELLVEHDKLDGLVKELSDKRFFHQHKVHGTPKMKICHQSYFRPYLSEERNVFDGEPGTVYPCDSLVLNDQHQRFEKKYQLCRPQDILNYLRHEMPHEPDFTPGADCSGCVFCDNLKLLDDWVIKGVEYFDKYTEPLKHEEFV